MTLTEFTNLAIGVPFIDKGKDFSGFFCWGVVLSAYQKVFGIEIPDPDVSAMDSEEAAKHFNLHCQSWIEINKGKEKPGDVVLFRIGRFIAHAGLVVKPGLMLHVDEGIDTCVESYYAGEWKLKLAGIYRHGQLTNSN